jgi:hypothetical protein
VLTYLFANRTVSFSENVFTSLNLGASRMLRMVLRDDQWEKIEKIITGNKGQRGRQTVSNCHFIESVT